MQTQHHLVALGTVESPVTFLSPVVSSLLFRRSFMLNVEATVGLKVSFLSARAARQGSQSVSLHSFG